MAAPMPHGKVLASQNSSSSSSDSSEDEQKEPDEKLRRFQDAVITADYFSDLGRWKKSSGTGDGPGKSSLPSKRSGVNEHEYENPLGTTPEFRAFVSKKLAEKLDREIEFCVTKAPPSEYASWINQDMKIAEEGVRLFSDSCHDLSQTDESPSQQPRPQKPRHQHRVRATTSDGYSCEADRLAAVAVTADFLAQERAMWTRLHEASRESTEKQDPTATTAGNETHEHTTSAEKKKKKKKKKRKDGEKADSAKLDTNAASGHSSQKEETVHSEKKKKRKREDDSGSSVSAFDESTDKELNSMETVNGEEYPPVKRKKTDNEKSRRVVTDAEKESCGEHLKKKKKKKCKKHHR